MEITEIRIKLMEGSEDRLRAFCSITIDQSFVVRDLKIIDGSSGPFVAMPSRKLTGHCGRCSSKNHLRATFCNHCGAKLAGHNVDSPQKLYADVAHPINSECREMIQAAVIDEFEAELTRSRQPGYRSRYDDDFDAGDYDEADYDETPSARVDESQSELDAPHGETESAGEDSEAMIDGANRDDTEDMNTEDMIVRGEKGDGHRVPRPHFHNRGGGSRGSVVGTSPRGDHGGMKAEGDDDAAESDSDGFGAGIFDA